MIELGLAQNITLPSGTPEDPGISDLARRLQDIFGARFDVLQPIAIGGMATIFQLRHRLTRGLFVAKVLHPYLASKPGIIGSFRAEAAHAARLGGHPNAVPVFDFGELDGLYFMTMPYIEGEDLDRLIERTGPQSRHETLTCTAQICSLLCFAETEGIVHCDLTPGNIRLDAFGTYRLLDFGVSHSREFNHQHLFRAGTPLYTSPEQLDGRIPDIRTDLYALGAITAELLTGQPLFQAETLSAIDIKHREGDWEMPLTLREDEVISSLLRKLLATNPEDRFQSAFEVSGALDGLGFPRPEFRRQRLTASSSTAQSVRRSRLTPG